MFPVIFFGVRAKEQYLCGAFWFVISINVHHALKLEVIVWHFLMACAAKRGYWIQCQSIESLLYEVILTVLNIWWIQTLIKSYLYYQTSIFVWKNYPRRNIFGASEERFRRWIYCWNFTPTQKTAAVLVTSLRRLIQSCVTLLALWSPAPVIFLKQLAHFI